MYNGSWDVLELYSLEKAAPKKISKKKVEGGFYYKAYREVRVLKKRDKKAEPESDYQKQEKERQKNRKIIKTIAKEMAAQRRSFVRNILTGNIDALKDTEKVVIKLWESLLVKEAWVGRNKIACFLVDGESWYNLTDEEKERGLQELSKTSFLHQLMIAACAGMEDAELTDYNGYYAKSVGEAITALTEALEMYGFSYADDEQNKVMEGSHECYKKQEVKQDDAETS